MKIYYPTQSYLDARHKNVIWYKYLLKGFEQIGTVILDEKMAELSTCKRGDTITVFEIEINDKRKRVYYDWCDFMVDHKERAIDQNALYFKIQAYEELLPIGQIVTNIEFLNKYRQFREIKNKNPYKYDIIGIFNTRNDDRRIKSCQIIRQMDNINCLVGMQRRSDKHELPEDLKMRKLSYLSHLQSQCESKLCLVLSGVGNRCAFSWRLTEALGMGCAVITHKHEAILPNHEYFEKNCIIVIKPDLSDLEKKINYYLIHDQEREKIARNGKQYFDKYLTPKAMAENIVNRVKKEIVND